MTNIWNIEIKDIIIGLTLKSCTTPDQLRGREEKGRQYLQSSISSYNLMNNSSQTALLGSQLVRKSQGLSENGQESLHIK